MIALFLLCLFGKCPYLSLEIIQSYEYQIDCMIPNVIKKIVTSVSQPASGGLRHLRSEPGDITEQDGGQASSEDKMNTSSLLLLLLLSPSLPPRAVRAGKYHSLTSAVSVLQGRVVEQ